LDLGYFLSSTRHRKVPAPETDGSNQNQQQVGLSRPLPVFASPNIEVPPTIHDFFVEAPADAPAVTAAGFARESSGRRPGARAASAPWTALAARATLAANGEKAGRMQLGY
jgi:hypothetical protein